MRLLKSRKKDLQTAEAQAGQGKVSSEVNEGDNAFVAASLLKYAVWLMGAVTLINLYQLAEIKDSYRATVQPWGSSEVYEITGREASENYLFAMGTSISLTFYAATPATAKAQHSVLLRLAHPTRYGALRERWEKRALQLRELKTATIYGQIDWGKPFEKTYLNTDKYPGLKNTQNLSLNVMRSIFIGSSDDPTERTTRTINIEYVIENGKFWLLDIIEETPRV